MIKKMFDNVDLNVKEDEIVPYAYRGVQFIKTQIKYVVAAFGEPFKPHYWKMAVNETYYYLYRTGNYFYILSDTVDTIDEDIEEIMFSIKREETAIWIIKTTTESFDHDTSGYFNHEPNDKEVLKTVIKNNSYEVFECGYDGERSLNQIFETEKDMLYNINSLLECTDLYTGINYEVFKTYLA